MTNKLQRNAAVVAGLVRALCRCCSEPQPLQAHAELDSAHLVCPETRMTYEDRGDGWFEQDGGSLDATCVVQPVASEGAPGEPDLLSDRPTRTGPKTRISLERATFAAQAINRGGGGLYGDRGEPGADPGPPSVRSVVNLSHLPRLRERP